MGLTIDWAEYDDLGPRARYDAIGTIIDSAKAAVAAKRAEIAAERLDALGAPAAAAELGISGARVYQLAARHRALAAQQTTEYGIWDDTIPGGRTLRDTIDTVLGGSADTFDVDGIEQDYRAAVNAALDDQGITLAGEVFYGPYPRPAEAGETIMALVEAVDMGEIMARHDRESTTD